MNSFALPQITLAQYFENPFPLLVNTSIISNNANRRDFINKFIDNLTIKSNINNVNKNSTLILNNNATPTKKMIDNPNKIIDTISYEKCLEVLNVNFYDDVILKQNGRKYAKFSEIPLIGQNYYKDIKKTLFIIYLQYLINIPSDDFNYNNMIELAKNIKDIWIDTNIFVLDLLLNVSFIHYKNPSTDLNTKLFNFYKNMKDNLGIIDRYDLPINLNEYLSLEINTTDYSLDANEPIYNRLPISNAPQVDVPEGYKRKVAKKRNSALEYKMKQLSTNLPMNVRPSLKYQVLSYLYIYFLDNSNFLNISDIRYQMFKKRFISRVKHGDGINVGGLSRNLFENLSKHFTHSIKLKSIRNLNEKGISKKKSETNNSNYIKEVPYVPYIQNFYTETKPDGTVVELSSNIQIILNIMFFTIISAGAEKRKTYGEVTQRINSFTIKESYLSHIFICYLIESILSLYSIPSLQKSIIKYQLYMLLTRENNQEGFEQFKNMMISLYCSIHNLERDPYYYLSLPELIDNNNKIFQHFIQQKMSTNDLSTILNTYYFNRNISTMTLNQQKITKTYFIHKFMLNHVVSKEITASPEDKQYIIDNLNIGPLPNTNSAIIENIITQFINSLNDEEMKIFVLAITGSTSRPNDIKFRFDNYPSIRAFQLTYKFATCFNTINIKHDYIGVAANIATSGPSNIPVAGTEVITYIHGYNPTESIIYNFLITRKNDTIGIMRSVLTVGGGFLLS